MAACRKEDRLVVVNKKKRRKESFFLFMRWDLKVDTNFSFFFFLIWKGCQSGVRSLYATTELLNAVSFFFSLPNFKLKKFVSKFNERTVSQEKTEFKEWWVDWLLCLLQDFKNVCNMGGGYLDWVDKGFPVKLQPAKIQVELWSKLSFPLL